MSAASSDSDQAVRNTFNQKYTEFAADLKGTFPELADELEVATSLKLEERLASYKTEVHGKHKTPTGATEFPCPGPVLPGVVLTDALWKDVGAVTKKAVYDYLSILDLCMMFDSKEGISEEWAEKVMGEWKSRLDSINFDSLTEKLKGLFSGKDGMPSIPERFLKGKLAKLAEDMVRDFKPEDFGLSPEELEALEKNPAKAFEILMRAATSNPEKLQGAMARVQKRLRDKVQRGELRPQELVAEAEEMINEFKNHPAFVEIMETFRSAFSFEDPETARASGQEENARRAIVRERLRKKLEAKKGGKKV